MKRNFVTQPKEGDVLEARNGEIRYVFAVRIQRDAVVVVYRSTREPALRVERALLADWSSWITDNDAKLIVERRKMIGDD